ncbi:hypothetical protein [Streptosporangium sp. NPDC048865]|uniref:hypothetical protein n=1 Tax=Streptosporangium sp. NPDC048865 TaxID=3155766 RepID=UPI0034494F4C
MAGTRNDSAHLAYLLTLAMNLLGWLRDDPATDTRTGRGHIDTVRTLATRYSGDQSAYRQIVSNTQMALAYLGRHAARCGFDHVRGDFITLRALCADYLTSLTHEQRVQLATMCGFDHAHLTEENTKPGRAPALVAWLNPVYGPDNEALATIQAEANRRYTERYSDLADADETDNRLAIIRSLA